MTSNISVIIPVPPNPNAALLERALSSINRQTITTEVEPLVIQNVTAYAAALNKCLVSASGEYVIFHEYTNFWEPDGMERIRSYIEEEHPFVWAVFTSSWNVDEKGKRIVAADPVDGLVAEQTTGRMEFQKEIGNTVNSAATIVRMAALRKVQDFDGFIFNERLRFHEDWELWLRFLKHRGKIVFREGDPVSNWYDNPQGRHKDPLNFLYKQMVYSRIRGGWYD